MMANNLLHRFEPSLEREIYALHDRYLEYLSDEELDRRYLSVRRQLRAVEIAATAEPLRWDFPLHNWMGPRYWLRKELLTAEELRLRRRLLPPLQAPHLPRFDRAHPGSLEGKRSGGDAFLVRFGEQAHLQAMHEHGEVRLSPAGALKAKENNVARQDDELGKHRFTRGEHLRVVDPRGVAIPVLGAARFTRQARNYYFLCVSNDFDVDLFADFEVDACLIIHDPAAFASRLEKAAKPQLADWLSGHFNVEYYDPYESAPGELINTMMSKNIFFAYEKEYRFCWAPPEGASCADRPLFLKLGPLTDITEMYVPKRIAAPTLTVAW